VARRVRPYEPRPPSVPPPRHHEWDVPPTIVVPGGIIDVVTEGPDRLWCMGWLLDGTRGACHRPAGLGTDHVGAGRCSLHGGNTRPGREEGAWLVAHAIAQARNITPWEALLEEVRRGAGEVAWLDTKVAEAEHDEDLLPGGSHAPWMRLRDTARTRLARHAKMAMDAGVAQQLVESVRAEGLDIALKMRRVLDALNLSEAQWDVARRVIREIFTTPASLESGALEGEVVTE